MSDNEQERVQEQEKTQSENFALVNLSKTQNSKEWKEEWEKINKLSLPELQSYAEKLIQSAVEADKANTKPDAANIFRGKGEGFFPLAVVGLLLKKQGYPSEEFMNRIFLKSQEAKKQHENYLKSNQAEIKAKAAAEKQGLDIKSNDGVNFIANEKAKLNQMKLHELTRDIRADILLEFQSKVSLVLPVLEPMRPNPNITEKIQMDYRNVIFSALCTLPLGADQRNQKEIGRLFFGDLFRFSKGKGFIADSVLVENNQLLNTLGETVNASPERRKPFAPVLELMTNPAYFETEAYRKLVAYTNRPDVLKNDSVDFVRFYQDFKSGKWDNKSNLELKKAIQVFLKGGALSLNIKSENMQKLLAAVPDHKNLDVTDINKQELKGALDVAYNDLMSNILKRDNFLIDSTNIKQFVAPEQSKATQSRVVAQQSQVQPKSTQQPSSVSQAPQRKPVQRFFSAVATFVTSGFSMKAAREEFNKGVSKASTLPQQTGIPEVTTSDSTPAIDFAGMKKKLEEQQKKFTKANGMELSVYQEKLWQKTIEFVGTQQSLQQNKLTKLSPKEFEQEVDKRLTRFVKAVNVNTDGLIRSGLVSEKDIVVLSPQQKQNIFNQVKSLKQDLFNPATNMETAITPQQAQNGMNTSMVNRLSTVVTHGTTLASNVKPTDTTGIANDAKSTIEDRPSQVQNPGADQPKPIAETAEVLSMELGAFLSTYNDSISKLVGVTLESPMNLNKNNNAPEVVIKEVHRVLNEKINPRGMEHIRQPEAFKDPVFKDFEQKLKGFEERVNRLEPLNKRYKK